VKPSVRALAFGLSAHQVSQGLGTTEGEEGAVQVAQAVLLNTVARILAHGVALSSFWRKDTVTWMVMEMEKPVNHSGNCFNCLDIIITFLEFMAGW